MKTDPKTDTLWKTYLVYILVLIFGIAIIAKIILVQTKDNKELEKLAEQREYRVDTLEASRGNIFSSDGQLMATTIPLYDVFFDYKSVDSAVLADNIDSLCVQMSELLPKRNPAQWKAFFAEGMAKKNRHYKIALNITQTELRQMQSFVIFNRGLYKGGLIIEKKIRREHPYKDLASLMLGMANEKKGYFFGLEGAYNDYLRGQNGRQLVRRIHHGVSNPVASEIYTDESDLPLREVLVAMAEKLGQGPAMSPKSDPKAIKAFFAEVVPSYDEDRFYVSHMKKILDWYEVLRKYASLEFVEEEEEEAAGGEDAEKKEEAAG